nr:MAG TPA: hypothetical protein [Caudoviricetes sp.]
MSTIKKRGTIWFLFYLHISILRIYIINRN